MLLHKKKLVMLNVTPLIDYLFIGRSKRLPLFPCILNDVLQTDGRWSWLSNEAPFCQSKKI